MKNVKFLPWVGVNYSHSKYGKRVMVLGESHYCANESDATSDITCRVFDDLLDANSEFEYYKNTYTKFVRALSGEQIARQDVKRVWDEVMFYNYVQFPIAAARVEPTAKEFADSEPAFWEVLEEYRPDIVIAWGKRLYNHLPKTGSQGADCADEETWIYRLKDQSEVRILPIIHPSASNFEIEYWHKVMAAFIRS